MKIFRIVSRILLGIVFIVSGFVWRQLPGYYQLFDLRVN